MRRALFVAYHFAPENVSGTHRSLHFARCLMDAGFDVTVLTRSLSSITSLDESLGDVFPWSDRITRAESRDTLLDRMVELIRSSARRASGAQPDVRDDIGSLATTGSFTTADIADKIVQRRFAALRDFVNWAQLFPDEHKGWYAPALKAGRRILDDGRVDVVLASGPPWTGVRIGAELARRADVPFVADYRDPWTRRSGRTWNVGGRAFDWLGAVLEDRVIRNAARVISNSPGITAGIRDGYPFLADSRLETILNGSNARRRAVATPFPTAGPLVARHFGSLYSNRRIGPLIAAATNRAASGAGWVVENYGPDPGAAYLSEITPTTRKLLNRFDPLPFDEAVERMHEPGLLVMIQPALLTRQIPTKLFDYLCTGNPVLLLATEESAAWTIARPFDRCYRADPDDVAGITRILAALEDRRTAGKLVQVPTADDTRSLTKESLGHEFTSSVARLLRPSPSP